jgi:hypothetical protein
MSLLAAGLSYGMNKLLDGDAWKNGLIHENRGKDIAVLCE